MNYVEKTSILLWVGPVWIMGNKLSFEELM